MPIHSPRSSTLISPFTLLQSFAVMIVGLLVLYGITRLVFLGVNKSYFDVENISDAARIFFHGLRYDISAIVVANVLLFFLWSLPFTFLGSYILRVICKYIFIFTNGIFLMTNLIDTAYFPFLQRRMQFDVFQYTSGKKGNEVLELFPRFIAEYWYLSLIFFVLLWCLRKLFNLAVHHHQLVSPNKIVFLKSSFLCLSMLTLCVLAFRGGLQLKPIDIINAAEVNGTTFIPLVINSPFSIYKSSDKTGVTCRFDNKTSPPEPREDNIHLPDTTKSFDKRNIIIIIVESLSEEYISGFGGASKTPFLDTLLQKSLVFRNSYANAKESIQGIPAIVSSIPSWQNDAFIFSPYSCNSITSFANLLRPYGYHTSFYHGGTTGTMGFDAYCKLAGIEHYFGREDYNNENDYDGHWGIWDEPFLLYMAKQLSYTQQPFFSTVFTLNTHHPFLLPNQHQQRFEQLHGHPILQSVQYADYALSRYFEAISTQPWFANTLFVITADHTGPALSDGGNFHKQYRIPIAVYDPTGKLQGETLRVANQIDILPTIIRYLHYPQPFFALGSNLLDTSCTTNYTYQYNAGAYSISDTAYTYQSDLEKDLGLFASKTDPQFRESLSSKYIDKQKSMDKALKNKMNAFCKALNENGLQLKKR